MFIASKPEPRSDSVRRSGTQRNEVSTLHDLFRSFERSRERRWIVAEL